MHRHRDMQRESRAEIHHEMALMRRAVRTWKTWICATKMRGGSADSEEEEGISTSESIGRNAGINEFWHFKRHTQSSVRIRRVTEMNFSGNFKSEADSYISSED